jgi:hypothetical protein
MMSGKNRTFLFGQITKIAINSYSSIYSMIYRFSVLLFVAAAIGLVSCKNNDEVFPVVTSASLNVVNASPDTLNFYLNGTRQNNSSSLFPGGQSLYLTEPSGLQNYQFKNLGTFSILFSVPLTLQASTTQSPSNYTLYVTGATSAGAFNTADFLDTVGINDEAHFKLRFVNASPNAGALNVTVDSTNYINSAFKSSSAFSLYGSGGKVVSVYTSGSSVATVDTTLTFQPGHMYTLFSEGSLNGKGTAALRVSVALNF